MLASRLSEKLNNRSLNEFDLMGLNLIKFIGQLPMFHESIGKEQLYQNLSDDVRNFVSSETADSTISSALRRSWELGKAPDLFKILEQSERETPSQPYENVADTLFGALFPNRSHILSYAQSLCSYFAGVDQVAANLDSLFATSFRNQANPAAPTLTPKSYRSAIRYLLATDEQALREPILDFLLAAAVRSEFVSNSARIIDLASQVAQELQLSAEFMENRMRQLAAAVPQPYRPPTRGYIHLCCDRDKEIETFREMSAQTNPFGLILFGRLEDRGDLFAERLEKDELPTRFPSEAPGKTYQLGVDTSEIAQVRIDRAASKHRKVWLGEFWNETAGARDPDLGKRADEQLRSRLEAEPTTLVLYTFPDGLNETSTRFCALCLRFLQSQWKEAKSRGRLVVVVNVIHTGRGFKPVFLIHRDLNVLRSEFSKETIDWHWSEPMILGPIKRSHIADCLTQMGKTDNNEQTRIINEIHADRDGYRMDTIFLKLTPTGC